MDLYIDLDGVLLDRHGNLAEGLEAFLRVATDRHSAWWLTTHCQGDAEPTLRKLRWAGASPETLSLAARLQPTRWRTLKTEAIDSRSVFLWLDDAPLEAERRELARRRCLHQLRIVDLRGRPHDLIQITEELARLAS